MITDARIEQLRTQARFMANGGQASAVAWADVAEALRELLDKRSSEFICTQCGLRKDGEKPLVEF